jgi:hypothetical protein
MIKVLKCKDRPYRYTRINTSSTLPPLSTASCHTNKISTLYSTYAQCLSGAKPGRRLCRLSDILDVGALLVLSPPRVNRPDNAPMMWSINMGSDIGRQRALCERTAHDVVHHHRISVKSAVSALQLGLGRGRCHVGS